MLGAALLCAGAQHHDAILVAPLAAMIGAFGAWRGGPRAAAPAIAAGIALLGYAGAQLANHLIPFVLVREPDSAVRVFTLVFQPELRSSLALAAMVGAGLLLRSDAGRTARRAAFLGIAITLSPYVMEFLSVAINSLSWREMWSFPFVLFIGLSITAMGMREVKQWRIPAMASAFLVLFLGSGIWTVAEANRNHFGDIRPKMDETLRAWAESGSDVMLPHRR